MARFDGPAGEGVTNAYDAFGRLTSSTLNMDGVSRPLSYRWDAGSRRTRVALPDGYFSSYAYDPAGRLTGIYHANGALLQTFAYDSAGRLASTARAAGNGTVYGYDGLSRPNALTHDLPARARTWRSASPTIPRARSRAGRRATTLMRGVGIMRSTAPTRPTGSRGRAGRWRETTASSRPPLARAGLFVTVSWVPPALYVKPEQEVCWPAKEVN